MSRIQMIPGHRMDAELREFLKADQRDSAELGPMQVYAHQPELAKAYAVFSGAMKRTGLLSRRLIELLRIRVAFHNQCRSCMAIRYSQAVQEGVSEDLVCQLKDPAEAGDLTDGERSALHFADLLATDHMAICDDTFDSMRAHFSEAEIVEIGMRVALFVGYGRLSMAWDLVDDLPDEFRESGEDPITPWGRDVIRIVED